MIGGAGDNRNDRVVPRQFARFRGGTRARIAVLTAATNLPGEVREDYIVVFERPGVETVRAIDTERREDADYRERAGRDGDRELISVQGSIGSRG